MSYRLSYLENFHFSNQRVPLIKMHCRVRYLLDFDLKIRSGQGCAFDYNFSQLFRNCLKESGKGSQLKNFLDIYDFWFLAKNKMKVSEDKYFCAIKFFFETLYLLIS